MKKRAVGIILGVVLTGTMFTGCGKNKATEAASESAQTEKEGVGEDVEKDSETDKKSDKEPDHVEICYEKQIPKSQLYYCASYLDVYYKKKSDFPITQETVEGTFKQ